jgi:hypothetical protein
MIYLILHLIAFVLLINWIAALHVQYYSLKDPKMKFTAIILAVALSVALFFVLI